MQSGDFDDTGMEDGIDDGGPLDTGGRQNYHHCLVLQMEIVYCFPLYFQYLLPKYLLLAAHLVSRGPTFLHHQSRPPSLCHQSQLSAHSLIQIMVTVIAALL